MLVGVSMILRWYRLRPEEAAALHVMTSVEFFDWAQSRSGGDVLDIEKNWHALNSVLTGSGELVAEPGSLTDLVLGGDDLPFDAGYGPPRLLHASRVRELADGLDALTDAQIIQNARRVNFIRDVYPYHFDTEEPEAGDHPPLVRDVARWLRQAADANYAVVTVVS